MQVHVQIINKSPHPLPTPATPLSAGMDLRAFVPQPIQLKPQERKLISTGIHLHLPPHTEGQVRPRSGLALKHGITVLNTPGTIDADYTGEIKVLLINHSDTNFTINNGDRIAQLIVANYLQVTWKEVSILPHTQRGEGGHGSTGIA